MNDSDVNMRSLCSFQLYSILISDRIRPPRGIVRWCEEMQLSDADIKTALTFAKKCSSAVFDHVFQFKIVTQILPTNNYLQRYRVKDSNACTRCLLDTIDTVVHSTWSCPRVSPYIMHIIQYLKIEGRIGVDINFKNYIFGFPGQDKLGLNQILLQLKKEIFYNWEENVTIVAFFDIFISKVKKLMIKEKHVALSKNSFYKFQDKWKDFCIIYDFRGPDCEI